MYRGRRACVCAGARSAACGTLRCSRCPLPPPSRPGVASLITMTTYRAGLDPSLVAGPSVATVVDATGVVIYLVSGLL